MSNYSGSKFKVIILCVLLFFPLKIRAEGTGSADAQEESKAVPVHITADEIEDIRKENTVIGRGNVEVKYKDYSIKAEKVQLNIETGDGTAEDHVTMFDQTSESAIECDKADFNIKTKKGTIFNGAGGFSNEYFFTGKKIERIDEDKYLLYDGSLTTCISNGSPSWKFKSKKASIHLEHYAHLTHPTFWIRNVPVLYLPYLIVPVKTKRATGLLFPYVGSSDKDGYSINNSFFWAVNEQSDATFYLDYMTKKGVRPGIEYRYTPAVHTTGRINGSYLKEKDTKREFWKLNLDHRQKLFYDIDNLTILDMASRNNPDKEFAYSAASRSKRYRDSYTSLTKNWENNSLRVQARYQKNIEYGSNEKTYQLPGASFLQQQKRIGTSPFFFNSESSYTFFKNDTNDESVEMHRLDIHPTITVPFNKLPYLTITPSAGIRETLYSKGKDEQGNLINEVSRELYDLNMRIEGPKFVKIFFDNRSSPQYKHLIEPRIYYSYIPDMDKRDRDEIWYRTDNGIKRTGFDSVDIIQPKNTVTYSLFNRVLKKKAGGASEIFRLEIKNSYDIREARGKDKTATSTKLQPFSNIRIDLDSNIINPFVFNIDGEYNIYEKRIDTANIETGFTYRNIWDFHVERRYSRGSSTFWTGSAGVTIYKNLSLRYSARYDELLKLYVESNYGIQYNAQCWEISLDFVDRKVITDGQRRGELKFLILITLKGIGSFGEERKRLERY